MARFCGNPQRLFPGLPFFDGFAASAAAGLTGVELPSPYEFAASRTRRALVAQGLSLVSIACPPPSYAGGAPGFAGVEGGADRFRHDLRRTLRYAEALAPELVELTLAPEALSPDALRTDMAHAVETAPAQRFAVSCPDPDLSLAGGLDPAGIGRIADVELGGPIPAHAPRAALIRVRPAAGSTGTDLAALGAELDAAGFGGWISLWGTPKAYKGGADARWLAGLPQG